MKIFNYELKKQLYIPDYISNDEVICFLDIETDGLSQVHNKIVLIGLFIVDPKNSRQDIFQIFAENNGEEVLLLKEFKKLVSRADTIFTYNGSTFDLPFLKKKFDKYSMDHGLDSVFHVDLLKKIRKHKHSLSLENCKLKTVEKKVGIERKDTISGRDSVLLYREYLETKNPSLEKTILRHNYEDIYYLPDILEVERLIGTSEIISLNTFEKSVKVSIPPDKIKLSQSMLKIDVSTVVLDFPEYIVFGENYSLNWNTKSGKLAIEFFLESDSLEDGRIFKYIDLGDFEDFDSNDLYLDCSQYETSLPPDMLVVSVEKDLIYHNILNLVRHILQKWI